MNQMNVPLPRPYPPQPAVRRRPKSHGIETFLERSQLIFVGTTAIADLMLAGYGFATQNQGYIYCSVAVVMFMIPAVIGLARRPRFDVFEPINIVAFSILFGTTMRAFYVLFLPERSQARFLMMEQTFGEINEHVLLVLLGVALFCAGYLIRIPRAKLERWPVIGNYEISRSKLLIATTLALLITFVGIVAFFVDFRIPISWNLLFESQKRIAFYATAEGDTVYSGGWETTIAQTAQYPFLIYCTAMFAKKIPATPIRIALATILFFITSFVPYLASTRTSIILLLFSVCVVGYYYRRLPLRTAVLSFAAVIFVVAGMGTIRSAGRTADTSVLDWTVGSGNGFDTIRATAVIDRVPRVHDHLYGSSYLAIPFFWVPRAVWPAKPEVGLGAWTKRVLFHQRFVYNAGWPPSVVGEAWINFGLFGILLVLPLTGVFFRHIYESCRPFLGKSAAITALYGVTVYRLGFNCFELDLSVGLVSTFTSAVALLAFLWLAKGNRSRSTQRTAQARAGTG